MDPAKAYLIQLALVLGAIITIIILAWFSNNWTLLWFIVIPTFLMGKFSKTNG